MIQINLLPPEYRPRTGTPVGRFVATLVGVVLVLSAGGAYAYTHFIELVKVKELRESREAETITKEKLRDRSLALQKEIDMYEKRRRAIQTINRSRTLWSRKLDQFFDIVTGQSTNETFNVWLDTIEVPTQLGPRRRATVRGRKPQVRPAGEMRFAGSLAMDLDTEALTLLGSFHKALTGDPENTRQPTEFFKDFMSINNPNIEIKRNRSMQDQGELIPPVVGTFNFDLKLNPIEIPGSKPAPRPK